MTQTKMTSVSPKMKGL